MGDLKRGTKSTLRSIRKKVSQTFESMKERSKQIGEVLGYEKAGITPKSDKTKRMMAEAEPTIIPMADEEELRRTRRRRPRPSSGRAATILSSEDDTLG